MTSTEFDHLERQQLSNALAQFASTRPERPTGGWIRAVRHALDMTVRQFAARLGVTGGAVQSLEKNEELETITLAALRKAARALDCDLVYAIVPRVYGSSASDNDLFDRIIERRAREIAEREAERVAHTMALEAQQIDVGQHALQVELRVQELIRSPRALWHAARVPADESARSLTR